MMLLAAMLICMTPFITTACGNDDDEPDNKPDNEQMVDDTRIVGQWKGVDYETTFVLTFDKNGNLTEKWTEGTDSETDTYKYTFKEGKLNFVGVTPVVANCIGNPPFDVSFSSGTNPTTMTISWETNSIKFTRQ